jgi:SAM-dependent methyltransferase
MKNTPEAEKYWDTLAGTVNFTIPLKPELFRCFFPLNARILDYGCGYGRTLQQLWELGYRNLLGVDFSAAMVARGHSQYPYLNLQVGTAGAIAPGGRLFDVILLFAVLTCILKDAEQQALINTLDNLLRPGGFLYVNDFLIAKDKRNQERYAKFHEKYGTYGVFELDEGGIVRHHDPKWVQQLLSPFEMQEYGVETYTTMLGHPARGFYYLGQKASIL